MDGDSDTGSAVLACEEQRRRALLAADGAALDGLLDDALVYVHSTGARDTKASYRAKVDGRVLEYLDIAFVDQQLTVLGDVALVTGRMEARIRKEGQERDVRSLFLTVWHRDASRAGAPWRLRAHQGTPLA